MEASLHPLRKSGNDEEGPQSPEGLLISALLESGDFNPEKYYVSDADIEAWGKLWSFCREYQTHAGEAPPLSLVTKDFPDFDLTKDVNPSWAASKLVEASTMRDMRSRIRTAVDALGMEDLNSAMASFEGIKKPRGHRKDPLDVFDHASMEEDFHVSKIEVPFPTLGRSTGGIGPSELWQLGARFGEGKTQLATCFAARAAKCGYRAVYSSLEMPAKKISRLIALRLAGNDRSLVAALQGNDFKAQKKALDQIAAMTPGSVAVFDPKYGKVGSTSAITEMAGDFDLVIVDHVGLMTTSDGRRAIDDWRAQALISNVLREATLATGTPILCTAQVNREGERPGSSSPPKPGSLAGSDALGQDADVVVTGKRLSTRTMVMEAGKNRDGPELRWWIRFDPAKNRFEEIPKDAMTELAAIDEGNKSYLD